ncbi:TonB-dependent receptor [Litoribacter populi]|uniref:TonB-dependent receptor n=1 Tax=Litoribacter populi TaxID=2598460 RepID=UPI00117EAC97|nr:TonB-dependent receptor [Litoribacter populi]
MSRYVFIVILLLFGFQMKLNAQDQSKRISGTFLGYSFERFVERVEKETGYQFYFDPSLLEDVNVSLVAEDNTIPQLLNSIFEGTNLKYSIFEDKKIFITPEKAMRTRFPNAFLKADEVKRDTSEHNQEETYGIGAFAQNTVWKVGSQTDAEVAEISGKVLSEENLPVIGVTVSVRGSDLRTITDENGKYALIVPTGRHVIDFNKFGGDGERRNVDVQGPGSFNVQFEEDYITLNEYTVTYKDTENVSKVSSGTVSMQMNTMKKLPAVLGEVDVIRSVMTMPGVQSVGEASVGFNVRGGAADQNLIMFNDATIYNPSHLFGMFSAFNSDLVEGVELYKAGAPIEYGGRLSSVLDVKGKYGNSEKIKGSGGIGLLTSRLAIDGPLNDKTTFAVGARTTYSDWILNLLEEGTEFKNGAASFYDLNLSVKHTLNDKNEIRLNAYSSGDEFRFTADTTFSYQNRNFNIGWNHQFNDDFSGDLVVGYDAYEFGIESNSDPSNAYDFGFGMSQFHLRNNFGYDLNNKHFLKFGLSSILYDLSPGSLEPQAGESLVLPDRVQSERALETSIFIGDEWEISNKFSVDAGLRYVFYQFLGPNTVSEYQEGVLPTEGSEIRTTSYGSGEIIQPYHGPEFRVNARYLVNNTTSIKAGINTSRQHIHMLTNTSSISPTDTWKLSDRFVRPQLGQQYSLGIFKNMRKNLIETSLEVYYRDMSNLLDYRSGATLILNKNIEREILRSQGRSYGAEVMLKKTEGRLNGWVTYTYSRSQLRTDPGEIGQKINNGNFYSSNFDQPHDVLLFLNYELTKRISPSLNANYSTGRPITLPVAKFEYQGSERVFFSERNAHRVPDFFRIDLAVNVEGSHKLKKLAHASWSFGVYNVLGRSNPYSAYFTPVNGVLQGYQLSIFARPIPFVTYNFKF